MTTHSSSFQRYTITIALRALICFSFIRAFNATTTFSDIDLSTTTLDPHLTGFMLTGNAAGDYFGYSVSTAGDINKDGYGDVIIGASKKNSNKGAVYVIYGGEKSSMSDIDLTTALDPLTTGFTITGYAGSDEFGLSVNTAGDINKDGYDDIIIGAPGRNSQKGVAYIIYGGEKSSMSDINLSTQTLDPLTTGFTITETATSAIFGISVSTAGDINKDGYSDIIVAARKKGTFRGAVYVIYGGEKSSMKNIVLSTALDPLTTGFMITGNAAYDELGWPSSTAGDINNDGYDDIIVAAAYKNSRQGAVYVIYGGEKSSMTNIDLGTTSLNPLTTGFMITGNAAADYFGYSVSTAGDLNKDGYSDIIVGAYNKKSGKGAAYVIYGGEKSSMTNIDLGTTSLNPLTTGFMITGNAASDRFGNSVSTIGDINKDGYSDVIIGASAKDSSRGAAYVVYGREKSSMLDIDLGTQTLDPLTTGFMITGNVAPDNFGCSVSTAGDLNNDGFSDIIVGAFRKNSYTGAAYVIYACSSCSVCPANCNQCSSPSECTECASPYFLYQSQCLDSCPAKTFISIDTCKDCPTNCNECSSASVCSKCQSPSLLYQSKCVDSCPHTTFTSSDSCKDCPSNCNQCSSPSECTECTSSYLLFQSKCFSSCPAKTFSSTETCEDCPSHCSSCTSQTSCQACVQGYVLTDSLCVSPPSSQKAQEKATQAVSSGAQGIGSVVCVGSATFPLTALVSKTVQNTRYLNLSVTTELSEIYQTWDTDMISWEAPDIFSNQDHFKTSPPLFARYGLGSPFLVNFWPTLLNIGIGFTAFIICILLQKLFERAKYKGWAYSLLQRLVAGSFNFALVQAYACLDDILFYLVLDIKTNPFNSFFSKASLICAAIFLAFGCLLVFFNFWTVKKYQNIKKNMEYLEAFNERNKYWELFYSDFNDDDLWSQSFFAILIIRSSFSSFIITVIYDYPLMQTTYLVILDGAIILFLYFKNPFNTLRGKLAQYYFEIITLLVHICTFILSLQDSFPKSSETIRLILSSGIIYLNTALIGGSLGFMFIEIYEIIRYKTKLPKHKQYENIAIQTGTEDTLDSAQNQTQTASQDQYLETETQRRLESEIDNQQAASHESFFLLSRMKRNPNDTSTAPLNLESSRVLELPDNSALLDTNPNHGSTQFKDLSTRTIMVRPRPRMRNQQPNRISSIIPSYTLQNTQLEHIEEL